MSVQVLERPASSRQMAYIRNLQTDIGGNSHAVSEEISAAEASTVIRQLVEKVQERNGINGRKKINEARLGMVMKECYRYWTSLGRDVCANSRTSFVREVTDVYYLFTEIVERLENSPETTR